MEKSVDRYLHKKFKKQLSIEPTFQNADKEEKGPVSSVVQAESLQRQNDCVLKEKTSTILCDNVPVKNSNESVPKFSTNNENLTTTTNFKVTAPESSKVAKSSISRLEQNDDSNLDVREKNRQEAGREFVDQQSSNDCISYVILKSSTHQNAQNIRAVNFDKRFNVSEPISSIPTAEASSILDNSYSKQYVTSKLVNLDNAGDISSNVSLANDDHLASTATTPISLTATQDETTDHKPSSESKPENTSECQNVEKSSGGKYICSYCNLACSKPSVLQKHIRAHTNERPYPCVSCGFSFKTRSNLYKHCRSRTHANRVMGNKAQEMNNEALDTDSQSKMECDQTTSTESGGEDCTIINHQEKTQTVDIKTKPYKPRFHTAKAFYDIQKECEDQKVPETLQNRPSNSDLLSLHINEVISKNNAIVNSESYLIKKRSMESCENSVLGEGPAFYPHVASDERHNDEPLNLTNKSRKRCLSEVAEPTMHTSLIKELLLKNLYADSMQCPHCKMIFQTVTELELHKLRSCKGHTKTGARYSRSSSVNVASILTKNKNAFDNIPYLQNTTFPMKSPGPFLGNTRLVESDKNKSFSFDDNLPTFQNNLQNPNELLKASLRYSVSPLTIQHDKAKKPPVKMFGGQVKITQSTGESKSFKIDNEEGEKFGNGHFADYSGRLSENRVVKSSLQSGGTVLQNKTNYNLKQEVSRSSPNVIHVYENSALSPSVEMVNMEKGKFSYDRQGNYDLENENKLKGDLLVRPPSDTIGSPNFNNIASTPYEYTSIMDFSQKAVKLLAPNLKQPNLSIPGVPMPKISSKLLLPRSPSDIKQELSSKIYEAARRPIDTERTDLTREPEARHMENIQFAQKQILLHQRLAAEPQIQSPNMCNPVNLFVNGKVVRYVPGIPGPVAADVPINVGYGVNNNRIPSSSFRPQKSNMRLNPSDKSSIPIDLDKSETKYAYYNNHRLQSPEKKYGSEQIEPIPKSPKLPLEIKTTNDNFLEMRSASVKSCELKSPAPKSPIPICSISESPRKFARPNTLALKPSIAAQKQHHGLTPTMFNQILISPDTPRNAKKYIQHFLHGNYFSYLGLKSSTKSVYCTLNKTQPFYVPHFKKLSMYSEWRQQDTKGDKLYVSGYDSRQRQLKYTTAGKATGDLVVHSSYKFVVTETCSIKGDDQGKSNQILGGYESTEDYTYVRGRGRGRYVCDQCGIRCKKPSMLKKHIRTHTNDRPFTCSHCNFSFKTKGNLTKHMKSKAHTKNYAASSSSSSSTQQSGTQSSDTDTDDSGMDSSDESTRQQEHEAAYGLLSLSQKTTQVVTSNLSPVSSLGLNPIDNQISFMNTEQVTQVNNSNFAKNKILDKQIILNFIASKIGNEIPSSDTPASKETQNLMRFLGKSNTSRPLTYPYTSDMVDDNEKLTNKINPSVSPASISNYESTNSLESKLVVEQRSNFSVVQKHNVHYTPPECFSSKTSENRRITIPITISYDPSYLETYKGPEDNLQDRRSVSPLRPITPVVKINDRVVLNNVPYNNANDLRKRKVHENDYNNAAKLHRMNSDGEAIDLSMPSLIDKSISPEMSAMRYNGMSPSKENELRMSNLHITEPRGNLRNESTLINDRLKLPYKGTNDGAYKHNGAPPSEIHEAPFFNRESENVINLKTTISPNHLDSDQHININYVIQENSPSVITTFTEVPNSFSPMDYDNSAMETLADIATKQVKLEKNTLAKSVASEYLKLATKHEFQCNDGIRETNNFSAAKDLNELIVKPEENRSCTVCSKNFSKPSQLRLHMNIHYIERPFRCDPCSVSFRTKGHLQKHERSASHHNKLSSSPLSSSSEPRPFKCSDCNIAFRIHGHLAKHLRSKMHIMKLECLAKVPFGLYAELERANSLLTEINTTDGDQCLESLKALARKVFMNDPSKLNQLEVSLNSTDASDS